MSRSRNPPQKGQGAARAKQMGLLLDLDPDGGMDSGGNDEDLEAELLALVGGGGRGGGGAPGKKGGGKAPLPMEDIERMAALCMKDLDEDDDDGDLEDDADLLAELNDVLEDDEEEEKEAKKPAPAATPPRADATPKSTPTTPSGTSGVESRLQERIEMYQTAITNAKAAGESSKVRRYERGLKTLQTMLTQAKKGKPINEDEIPPPVATGAKPASAEPIRELERPPPDYTPPKPVNEKSQREAQPAVAPKPHLLQPPSDRASAVTPDTPAISPLTPSQPNAQQSELKTQVQSRQREYKLAALHAKQAGDSDLAKQLYQVAKSLDSVVEAVDKGEPVDVGSLPPPLGEAVAAKPAPPPQTSTKPAPTPQQAPPPQPADAPLAAPRTLAEALQQRMDRYKAAAENAKSKGDDRKARMHQRIVKQYQDAIKAHKAGRPVNLAELPVPPGCPPLQGSEGGEQNFMGVLETAMKLANRDADAEDDDDEEEAKTAHPAVQKARAPAPPSSSGSPAGTPPASTQAPKLGPKSQQQLDFLMMRREQFRRAALRSKQMKDMQGASQHLGNAKRLEPMIEATKSGLPVDISKVPSAPVNEDDYSLGRSRSSSRPSEQHTQLMDLLRRQHEKCLALSHQFTQMSNIGETVRFEKLAAECMNSIDILKAAYAKGLPLPKYHTEERTYNTLKVNNMLTANEMLLTIVKGVNLPAPPGVSPSDLDASVRFEFPFPSAEEAQRDKTGTVKNTSSPEFRQDFRLNINRNHRGFKRVVQSKGIKFEIIHKGGLFKTDKVVGNAQLKLEALEKQCDIREIIDVLDGRKATGGKLEVKVKIREPLGGAQLQSVTDKWIVLEPLPVTPDREKERRERERDRAPSPRSRPRSDHGQNVKPSLSPPQYKLYSFSLLNNEKERLERKIGDYSKSRRDPPSDLLRDHKDICNRLQWQRAYLGKGSSALREYEEVLKMLEHSLGQSVTMYSQKGNRDAAKEALYKKNLVEKELNSVIAKRRSV
ncbi:coiled-coil and C2 domain-containing protein 1A [Chanos chanos]|uniref:Coiled-coil and C2 domain-containing protein 1B n=1 Tax=Chanos chanos TaxID=29144 RepID=A0A6J2VS21_CHACN|nr:coiled-coil and C2 domain-containing protein 1A [Chanos chanos]